jgi:uncharacterized repeat protein (TIGR03803 family)
MRNQFFCLVCAVFGLLETGAFAQGTVLSQNSGGSVEWLFEGEEPFSAERAYLQRAVQICPSQFVTLTTEAIGSTSHSLFASGSGGVAQSSAAISLLQADVVNGCLGFGDYITLFLDGFAGSSASFMIQLDEPAQVSFTGVRNGAVRTGTFLAKPPFTVSVTASAAVGLLWPQDLSSPLPLSTYGGSDTETIVVRIVPSDLKEAVLRGMEITQSVQDWNNSVPLIQGKPTFVRIALGAKEKKDENRRLSGTLSGFRDFDPLPKSPLRPIRGLQPNPTGRAKLRPDAATDRLNGETDDKGLIFSLPPSWCIGTITLRFESKDAILVPEEPAGPPDNLPGDAQTRVTFHRVARPKLVLVPMRVKTPGEIIQPPDRKQVLRTLAAAKARLPLEAFRLSWDEPVLISGSPLTTDKFVHILYRKLRGDTLGSDTIYYGVADEPVSSRVSGFAAGVAIRLGGNLGWSTIRSGPNLEAGANTMAHEFSHLFGRPHSTDTNLGLFNLTGSRNYTIGHCGETNYSTTLGSYPWFFDFPKQGIKPALGPVSDPDSMVFGFQRTIPTPGQKPKLDVHSPSRNFDLMSYCFPFRWPSAHTYTHVFQHITNRYFTLQPARFGGILPTPLPGEQLVVRASVDLTTGQVAWMPFECALTGSEEPSQGPFELRAFNGGGEILSTVSFDLPVPEDGDPRQVPLLCKVPADTDIRYVELWHGATLMATRTASPNAPQVTLLAPNGGQSFSNAPVSIQWQATDPDGDALSYSLEYTEDGEQWRTIAVDLEETSLVVHSSELRGGPNARFRVFASDGFNCAFDESDGPSVVADTGPDLVILSPADDQVYYGDSPISFEALCVDLEDELSAGAGVLWHSDQDGVLGTGELQLNADELSPGAHRITATVSDSSGQTNAASINIYIEPVIPPSLEALGRDTNGLLRLELVSELGTSVQVDWSSNLVHWVAFTNFTFADVFSKIFTVPASAPSAFFRASASAAPPDLPSFALQPQSIVSSNASTFFLSAAVIAPPPLRYQWYFDGEPLAAQTNTVLFLPSATPFQSGAYYLVASNTAGCATSSVATVAITNGSDYQVITRFGSDSANGVNGYGALALDAEGWLYGCCLNGGISNAGVIYRVRTNGSSFTVLRRLDGTNSGSAPMSGLLLASNGVLFGACNTGGTNNAGTLFSLNRDGTAFTVLKHFLSFGDCRNPQGELLEGSDGRIYGTAYNGGGFGRGGVWVVNKDGSGYQVLYGFRNTDGEGLGPLGGLTETPDGFLYGTTEFGGQSNRGTIFASAKPARPMPASRTSAWSSAAPPTPNAPWFKCPIPGCTERPTAAEPPGRGPC